MMRRTRIKSWAATGPDADLAALAGAVPGARTLQSVFDRATAVPTALNQEGPYRLASQRACGLDLACGVALGRAGSRLDAGLDLPAGSEAAGWRRSALASSYWYMALRAAGSLAEPALARGMLVDFVLSLVMRSALPPVRTIQPVEDLALVIWRALENSLAFAAI